MAGPIPIGTRLLLLMIGERRIRPSVSFWVLSSLGSWWCSPSDTGIPSPIICVYNILAQSEHEMFFLGSRRWQTCSLSVWDNVRSSEIRPRIFRNRFWCRLAPLLLFRQWIEIENDCLFLHHLILSDLSKAPFIRRCTSSSAVTLHLLLMALRAFKVGILLCVSSRETAREKLSTKHCSRICRTGKNPSLEIRGLHQGRNLGLVVVFRLVFLHFISTYILFHT